SLGHGLAFATTYAGPSLTEPRQLELAEEHDLVLQLDAELLVRPPPGLGHQRNRVVGARVVGVLDEIRVSRRYLGATDPVPLEAARLAHPPGGALVVELVLA